MLKHGQEQALFFENLVDSIFNHETGEVSDTCKDYVFNAFKNIDYIFDDEQINKIFIRDRKRNLNVYTTLFSVKNPDFDKLVDDITVTNFISNNTCFYDYFFGDKYRIKADCKIFDDKLTIELEEICSQEFKYRLPIKIFIEVKINKMFVNGVAVINNTTPLIVTKLTIFVQNEMVFQDDFIEYHGSIYGTNIATMYIGTEIQNKYDLSDLDTLHFLTYKFNNNLNEDNELDIHDQQLVFSELSRVFDFFKTIPQYNDTSILNLKKLKKNLIAKFPPLTDSSTPDPKYTEHKHLENEHMMILIKSISKNINQDELEQLLYDYYYISDDIKNLLWVRNHRFKIVQYILLNIAATLQILFKCFDKSAYNSLKYECVNRFHYLQKSKNPRSQKISKQQAGRQYNRQYNNNPISILLTCRSGSIKWQDIIQLVFNHARLNEIYRVVDFSTLFGMINFITFARVSDSIDEHSTNLMKTAITKLNAITEPDYYKHNSIKKENYLEHDSNDDDEDDSDLGGFCSVRVTTLPQDYDKITDDYQISKPITCLTKFLAIVNNPKINIHKLFGKEYIQIAKKIDAECIKSEMIYTFVFMLFGSNYQLIQKFSKRTFNRLMIQMLSHFVNQYLPNYISLNDTADLDLLSKSPNYWNLFKSTCKIKLNNNIFSEIEIPKFINKVYNIFAANYGSKFISYVPIKKSVDNMDYLPVKNINILKFYIQTKWLNSFLQHISKLNGLKDHKRNKTVHSLLGKNLNLNERGLCNHGNLNIFNNQVCVELPNLYDETGIAGNRTVNTIVTNKHNISSNSPEIRNYLGVNYSSVRIRQNNFAMVIEEFKKIPTVAEYIDNFLTGANYYTTNIFHIAIAFCKYFYSIEIDPKIKQRYVILETLLSDIYIDNNKGIQIIEDILAYDNKLKVESTQLMFNWRNSSLEKFMELIRVKEQANLAFRNTINFEKFINVQVTTIDSTDIFSSPEFITWSEFITGLATNSIPTEASYLKFNAIKEFNDVNKSNNIKVYQLLTKQMYNAESDRMNNCIRSRHDKYCKWDSFAFALEVDKHPYNIEVSFDYETKKYSVYESKAKNNKPIDDSKVNKLINEIIGKCQQEFEVALELIEDSVDYEFKYKFINTEVARIFKTPFESNHDKIFNTIKDFITAVLQYMCHKYDYSDCDELKIKYLDDLKDIAA